MPNPVPRELATGENRAVLRHVEHLSAHSDIVEVLMNAVKPLGDVQLFCPDWAAFRYVVASTRGVIFGLAVGMHTVAFRLDAEMKRRALETGAIDYPDCGADWAAVVHHRQGGEWPAVDVQFWASRAYSFTRNAPGSSGIATR